MPPKPTETEFNTAHEVLSYMIEWYKKNEPTATREIRACDLARDLVVFVDLVDFDQDT